MLRPFTDDCFVPEAEVAKQLDIAEAAIAAGQLTHVPSGLATTLKITLHLT